MKGRALLQLMGMKANLELLKIDTIWSVARIFFLEGMLIAAWAVEAEKAYIYMRDEYPAVFGNTTQGNKYT